MGAWGAGHFENDDALDFLGELEGLATLSAVFAALPPAGEGEVEAPEASRAMAAAEVVAAMKGCSSGDCPDALSGRLAELGAPSAELIEQAREAVSRVLFDSELVDLWAESDEGEAWNLAVTDLIERLNPSAQPKAKTHKKKAERSGSPCAYCLEPVEDHDGIMVSITSLDDDQINRLDLGFFCHLTCFNGKLHPKRMIQRWKVDPDDPAFQAAVDKILGRKPE